METKSENLILDSSPSLLTPRESDEFNSTIIKSHDTSSKNKFCMVNAAIIVFIVIGVLMLLFCCHSYVQNVYFIEMPDESNYDSDDEPEYNTETNIDSNGALISIVTDKQTGERVANIRKSRTNLVETKNKTLFQNRKPIVEMTAEITYKDATFKEIVSEKHSSLDLSTNKIIERKELTKDASGMINMTIKNFMTSELYKIMIPVNGAIENQIFMLNSDESAGKQLRVELLSKNGDYTVHVQMIPGSDGKIIRANRIIYDIDGNVVNDENITTQVDRMYISSFTNQPMQNKSGFTGDLPAMSANVNIETDDYATAAMKMSLESGIYDQQKKYVADRNRFSNVSGYSSERDDPNNLVPWMGLRPPVYGKNLVESDARAVPSEMNDAQMTAHKQIRWN
jgi:hypothetical protein